uniref:Uncharacterized protein n=1 Tax=viral metagenome TaxID=1070528 RepID=A0A6C0ASV2_9ZZZZ
MDTFSLTRYLYPTVDVRQSLFMSMLDRNLDESLFWAFELFYSNDFIDDTLIETSTFEYVKRIYDHIYRELNPDIDSWINKKLVTMEPDIALASLINTLIQRQYSIVSFLEHVIHVKCEERVIASNIKKFRILLAKDDICKYKTIDDTTLSPRNILKTACRFAIRTNISILFNTFIPGSLIELWTNHWLYYAARTPIWATRINRLNGWLNEDKLAVEFDEEYVDDNDLSDFDEFHNRWNYEPDEQSIELRNRIIGNYSDNAIQMNIQTFCSTYGAYLPIRKLQIRN